METQLENPNDNTFVDKHGVRRYKTGAIAPGNTANPHGRPPGEFNLTSLVKNKLQEIPKGQQKSYAIQLIEKMLDQAIRKGDTATQKLIWNYIEGLPRQTIGLDGGAEGRPIPLLHVLHNNRNPENSQPQSEN